MYSVYQNDWSALTVTNLSHTKRTNSHKHLKAHKKHINSHVKAMLHSHYVQFAHIPRMKFWSYVDIRGEIDKSWGLYVKFSQMYHE